MALHTLCNPAIVSKRVAQLSWINSLKTANEEKSDRILPADMPGASRICTRNSAPETGIFSEEGQGADSGKISAGALARDET